LTAANHSVGATLKFMPDTAGGIQFAAAPTAVLNGALTNAYIVNPTTGAIDFVGTPAINTNIAASASPTGALPTATGAAAGNYLIERQRDDDPDAVAANTIRITGGDFDFGPGTSPFPLQRRETSGGILHDNSGGASTISGAFNIARCRRRSGIGGNYRRHEQRERAFDSLGAGELLLAQSSQGRHRDAKCSAGTTPSPGH